MFRKHLRGMITIYILITKTIILGDWRPPAARRLAWAFLARPRRRLCVRPTPRGARATAPCSEILTKPAREMEVPPRDSNERVYKMQ